MVFSGERENNKFTVPMGTAATTTSKKLPLHNFTLPDCLSWGGSQRMLRCRKVGPPEDFLIGRQRKDDDKGFNRTPSSSDGIEAVRAKLILDLQTAADDMKVAILDRGLSTEATSSGKETTALDGEKGRPWNLGKRCRAPNGTFSGGVKRPNFSPLRTDNEKSTGLCEEPYAEKREKGREREREKFSVSLLREEIQEDFMVMVGRKPRRRPKKRPKIVQKQLDSLFPGLWLTEVTADMYKVADAP